MAVAFCRSRLSYRVAWREVEGALFPKESAKHLALIPDVPQMTRANVGSLLVFDPEKMHVEPSEADKLKSAAQDAVVGIVTERGAVWCSMIRVEPLGRPSTDLASALGADYLTKVFVAGKQSNSTHVREIMTPQTKMKTKTKMLQIPKFSY